MNRLERIYELKDRPTLKSGDRFFSPGMSFEYEVVGAVCLLYDRSNLPYPCCSLQWRGLQPAWKRIGKRFIADVSSKGYEAYHVKLINCRYEILDTEKIWVFTYWDTKKNLRRWWWGI